MSSGNSVCKKIKLSRLRSMIELDTIYLTSDIGSFGQNTPAINESISVNILRQVPFWITYSGNLIHSRINL